MTCVHNMLLLLAVATPLTLTHAFVAPGGSLSTTSLGREGVSRSSSKVSTICCCYYIAVRGEISSSRKNVRPMWWYDVVKLRALSTWLLLQERLLVDAGIFFKILVQFFLGDVVVAHVQSKYSDDQPAVRVHRQKRGGASACRCVHLTSSTHVLKCWRKCTGQSAGAAVSCAAALVNASFAAQMRPRFVCLAVSPAIRLTADLQPKIDHDSGVFSCPGSVYRGQTRYGVWAEPLALGVCVAAKAQRGSLYVGMGAFQFPPGSSCAVACCDVEHYQQD